jgi:hypothetical protein
MISLSVLFWIFVALFAIIGAMRGWAREMLVMAGAIVALFLVSIIESYIPFIRDNLTQSSAFWVRMSILFAMTLFGYQSPKIPRIMESGRFIRERFEDVLLGVFLGGINGYLIFGTAWHYLIEAGYPFDWIIPPTEMTENMTSLIKILPPVWIQPPVTYIAVAVIFVFILVVFI